MEIVVRVEVCQRGHDPQVESCRSSAWKNITRKEKGFPLGRAGTTLPQSASVPPQEAALSELCPQVPGFALTHGVLSQPERSRKQGKGRTQDASFRVPQPGCTLKCTVTVLPRARALRSSSLLI